MEERHLTSAAAILRNIHYINIATVCGDGSPWNTPVSASFDTDLNFIWGSSPENIHSQNIDRDSRTFVTIYDSTVPEGTGEAVYMLGAAEELPDSMDGAVMQYRFVPAKAWINDEAKNEDGAYTHDIRIDLDLSRLKKTLQA